MALLVSVLVNVLARLRLVFFALLLLQELSIALVKCIVASLRRITLQAILESLLLSVDEFIILKLVWSHDHLLLVLTVRVQVNGWGDTVSRLCVCILLRHMQLVGFS